MSEVITVHCPSCETAFPVDPAKIPAGGVSARCSVCRDIFRVEEPGTEEAAVPETSGSDAESFGNVSLEASAEAYAAEAEAPTAEPEAPETEGDTGFALEGERETGESEGVEVEEVEVDTADYFFAAEKPTVEEVEEDEAVEEEGAPGEASETSEAPRPMFGQRSPEQKAERLARVLVSDMITYNPDLFNTARERGTLPEDFADEIQKSWEEYVDQVGQELAESTSYWKNALNEILAEGQELF